MNDDSPLAHLSLSGLAHRCAEESARFFQQRPHDPRYCYELFRRAVVEDDQGAWECIYTQFRSLVTSWVTRHPAFSASEEEAQFFVNRAFEKMWSALTPEKFARFPDLSSLLKYLQLCVHSVIIDHVRAAEVDVADVELRPGMEASDQRSVDWQERALDRVRREEFWSLLQARLRDEKEQRVVYGCYVLAMKPRELFAQCGDLFGDVREIYRVKQNVLERLRRDPALAQFVGPNAARR